MEVENVIVLSEEMLSNNICAYCFKYLSVWPICQNGNTSICGRCYRSELFNVESLKFSKYNDVAKYFLFKCVNHYDGCNMLLSLFETRNHEKNCKGTTLNCDLCSFKGISCQLIAHINLQHSDYIIQNDCFDIYINNEMESTYYFWKYEHIFLFKIFSALNKIYFNLTILREKCWFISNYRLKFSRPDISRLEYVTEEIKCSSINTQNNVEHIEEYELLSIFDGYLPTNEYVTCTIILNYDNTLNPMHKQYNLIESKSSKINKNEMLLPIMEARIDNLNELLKKFLKFYSFSVACLRCKSRRLIKLYICSSFHIYCEICSKEKCPKCNFSAKLVTFEKLLEFKINCYWDHCTKQVNLYDFYSHKQKCKFRKFKCPQNSCPSFSKIKNFVEHWHLNTLLYRGKIYQITNNITTLKQFYWLIEPSNELFRISFTIFRSENGRKCVVNIENIWEETPNCSFTVHSERNNHRSIESTQLPKNVSTRSFSFEFNVTRGITYVLTPLTNKLVPI